MANETILVVDTDTKSQKVLEVSFKRAGYRVVMTDDPRVARRRIETEAPDLIISDTRFPGVGEPAEGSSSDEEESAASGGFEFLRWLKEDQARASIPFIFLTEERSLPQKMKGFELGADDYLTKPVYIKEVTTRVELLLQRRARDLMSDDDVEVIEGDLAHITMIDLLQTIEEERRSGSIHLNRRERSAVVYFREGNILDAICGKLQGEEAIYRLMLWPDGAFTLRYHDQEGARRSDRIEKNSSALLLEGIRRLDRWNEALAGLPDLGSIFETDYTRLPSFKATVPVEVGRVLRLFDGLRTLREVVDDSPFDDVTTLQVVRKLIDDDVLLDVTPAASGRGLSTTRTNLAAWLEGNPATSEEPSAGYRKELADTIRQTNPGIPGIHLDDQQTNPGIPASQVDEVLAEVDQSEPGSWKFHFDEGQGDEPSSEQAYQPAAEDHDAAMRRIEEDEQVRREQEARRLAGDRPHAGPTLRYAPLIDRDDDSSKAIEEAERVRREEEARQIEAQRRQLEQGDVSDPAERSDEVPGVPGSRQSGEQNRVNPGGPFETLRSAPTVGRDPNEAGEEQPRGGALADVERRRRDRTATPISTPAATTLGPVDAPEEHRADEPLPHADEAQTRSFTPRDPVEAPSRSADRRQAAIEEADSIKRAASETMRHSGRKRAVTPTPDSFEAMNGLSGLSGLSEEVSEADAFVDDEGDEIPAGLDRRERPTKPTKAPAGLTPLGQEASEPEVDEEGMIDAQGDEQLNAEAGPFDDVDELEEPASEDSEGELPEVAVEALAKVERHAKDQELITARYDLARSGTGRVPGRAASPRRASSRDEPSRDPHEIETVELEDARPEVDPDPTPVPRVRTSDPHLIPAKEPAKELAAVVGAGDEVSFFDAAAKLETSDGWEYAESSRSWVLPVVGALIAIVVVAAFLMQGEEPQEQVDAPVAEAPIAEAPVAPAPDPIEAPEPVVQPVVEPVVEPVGLDPIAAPGAAASSGQGVGETATGLALVLSDQNQGAVAPLPEDGSDEPVAQAAEPVAQAAEPVEEPAAEPAPSRQEDVASTLRRAEKMLDNDPSGALALLRDLTAQAPSNARVAFVHGRAASYANRNDEAIMQFGRAEGLGFRRPELYIELGAAHQISGNTSKARAAYETYLKLQPEGRQAEEIRSILSRL